MHFKPNQTFQKKAVFFIKTYNTALVLTRWKRSHQETWLKLVTFGLFGTLIQTTSIERTGQWCESKNCFNDLKAWNSQFKRFKSSSICFRWAENLWTRGEIASSNRKPSCVLYSHLGLTYWSWKQKAWLWPQFVSEGFPKRAKVSIISQIRRLWFCSICFVLTS